jgi:hypothetical protein
VNILGFTGKGETRQVIFWDELIFGYRRARRTKNVFSKWYAAQDSRTFFKEREKEHLFREPGDEELMPVAEQLYFGWKQDVRKYRKMASVRAHGG